MTNRAGMMEEFVLDAKNFFFTSQDFLSFFFFFLNTKEKDFLVSRLNSPNVDIFFFLLFCLGSSPRLRRVAANGEKRTWSLARLGSSSTHVKRVFNYRADGEKGSAVCSSRLRSQKKSRKWETRAVSRCCFTHTCKKKEGEEENVIFSKKIPKDPTQSMMA